MILAYFTFLEIIVFLMKVSYNRNILKNLWYKIIGICIYLVSVFCWWLINIGNYIHLYLPALRGHHKCCVTVTNMGYAGVSNHQPNVASHIISHVSKINNLPTMQIK